MAKTKVYIQPNSWIAFLAAKRLKSATMAIVVNKTIHLYKTTPQEFLAKQSWVLHELKHVEQYERLGFANFIYTYLKESFLKGYYKNALEIEARCAEYDESLLQKYEIIST